MKLAGNLTLLGGGSLQNARIENLAADPASPQVGQVWYHTGEEALKYYDGTEIHQIAKGGNLDEYLRRDGSNAMTADLPLSSTDQSASADTAAVSKGHLDTVAATKQDTITGAATSIVDTDLTADVALVADASGKVAASAVSSAELAHLSGVTAPIQGQIDSKQDDLGYVPVDKAGDSMDGNLAMQGNLVKGLGAPVDGTDAARKIDIDSALAGMNWQEDIDGIQTDDTLDPGASPATGARYIITDTSNMNANFGTPAGVGNNDIVEYNGTEFAVVFDADGDADAAGAICWVADAELYVRYEPAGSGWTEFGGLSSLVAGIGLVKSGNVLDINMGAGIAELPSDEVGIDVSTTGGMMLTVDGTTDSVDTAAKLAMRLDGATLKVGSAGVAINEEGVDAAQIAAAALGNGIAGGAGVALNVVADTGITVSETGVALDETHTDTLYARLDGATFTGPVVVPVAGNDTEAVQKLYVDTADQALQDAIDALSVKLGQGHFVYDGTASASAVHTVTHSMGVKYVGVTIVDDTDEVVLPDSIVYTDENSLVVSFSQPVACRVVCNGAKA